MLLIIGAIVFLISSAAAQAPNSLMYQGRLTTNTGAPITAATNVVFAIYANISGGTALWTSGTVSITPDQNGVFTVELVTIPTTVFNGSKRYMGITVAGDTEMIPRQILTSAPYSYNAATSPAVAYIVSLPGGAYNALASGMASIDSITVTVPAAGYIHVLTEFSARINHTNGTEDYVGFQVTPTRGSVAFQNYGVVLLSDPAAAATASYRHPISISRVFTVAAAGTYKYFANSYFMGGWDASDAYYELQMTAFYYPVQCGTVTQPAALNLDNQNQMSSPDPAINEGHDF